MGKRWAVIFAKRQETDTDLQQEHDVSTTPVFADLGCGDGRVVITVCRALPKCYGYGVDINSTLIKVANARAQREGVATRCQFQELDLVDANLAGSDVVFLNLPAPSLRYVVTSVLPYSGLKEGAALFSADGPLPIDMPYCSPGRIVPDSAGGLFC